MAGAPDQSALALQSEPAQATDSALLKQVIAALRETTPTPAQRKGVVTVRVEVGFEGAWLMLAVFVFVALGAGFDSVGSIVLLVAILLFHELGHLVTMLIFGYRDRSVFFIPLFGSASGGRKERAPAWQQAIILLMGPTPGLIWGFLLALFGGPESHPLYDQTIGLLLVVNALNLLPFEPFDGGRIVGLLVFSEHPRARVVFGALTALALSVAALMAGLTLMGICVLFLLVTTSARYEFAGCIARLRKRIGARRDELPPRLADAPEAIIGEVYSDWIGTVRGATMAGSNVAPKAFVNVLNSIYDAVLTPSAGLGARLALGTLYLLLALPSALLVRRIFLA